MRLIGMLDSPYVRRVAVSLKLMGLPFEHESVSVFRHVERFRSINPIVKAPTLVADDGTVLMDSTLILDYAETLAAPDRRLLPAANPARLDALHRMAVALAACEKCVQVVYERERRAVADAAWMERITWQARAGFDWLERELAPRERFDAGDVALACTWRFTQLSVADVVDAARYPRIAAHSARAEALPAFSSTPPD